HWSDCRLHHRGSLVSDTGS
ncbi:MMPL family protein, partial [Vibrio parahaemolyticus AQ3810]